MVIGTTMTTMIKVTLQVVQMVSGLLSIKRKGKAMKKKLWIKEPLQRKKLEKVFEMDPHGHINKF